MANLSVGAAANIDFLNPGFEETEFLAAPEPYFPSELLDFGFETVAVLD